MSSGSELYLAEGNRDDWNRSIGNNMDMKTNQDSGPVPTLTGNNSAKTDKATGQTGNLNINCKLSL